MANVGLKSVISSRFLGGSRRRTHLKSVAGASQDLVASRNGREGLELNASQDGWGSRVASLVLTHNTSPS
eukprot:6199946-Prymnesium_polylepis.1